MSFLTLSLYLLILSTSQFFYIYLFYPLYNLELSFVNLSNYILLTSTHTIVISVVPLFNILKVFYFFDTRIYLTRVQNLSPPVLPYYQPLKIYCPILQNRHRHLIPTNYQSYLLTVRDTLPRTTVFSSLVVCQKSS